MKKLRSREQQKQFEEALKAAPAGRPSELFKLFEGAAPPALRDLFGRIEKRERLAPGEVLDLLQRVAPPELLDLFKQFEPFLREQPAPKPQPGTDI